MTRSTSEIKRFRAIIHGRVQGVNFRYSAQEQAESLGLTGYVRNLWDRTVEVLAEGPEGDLERLLAWLQVGPPSARVARVDVQWQAPVPQGSARQFQGFEVRF